MSPCAKPLDCGTSLRVPRSKTIAQPKTNPSCVRHSMWRRHISNLRMCRIGCEIGLNFYERAKRASNDHNFQAIYVTYIALHIFRAITQFCRTFPTSHCTLLCGNSTIYVKLLINWKLLSVGNRIKTSGTLGLVRIFQCPHVPNRWIVTHLYVSIARRSRSNTVA